MRTVSRGGDVDPVDRPSWGGRHRQSLPAWAVHARRFPRSRRSTCAVTAGRSPRLVRAYMRNGPNPVLEPKGLYHWFDGDGMVHAVYFRDGRASYIRRWVRTRALRDDIEDGRVTLSGIMGPFELSRDGSRATNPDYCKDTSNTTLTWHNGRVLSNWYNAGRTYALDPLTLDTVADETFGGAVDATFNAHAKCDPRTGELINYDYGDFKSYLTYYVIGADGKLKHKTRVDLAGPAAAARHDDHAELHDPARLPAVSTTSTCCVTPAIVSWSSTATFLRASA